MKKYRITWEKIHLSFKTPVFTSRGVLQKKVSYLLHVYDSVDPTLNGLGEISLIPDLSPDDPLKIEAILAQWENEPFEFLSNDPLLEKLPALQFGVEMALLSLHNKKKGLYFDNTFTQRKTSLRTNGLIWMSELSNMQQQIEEKIKQGFQCIKLKIGKHTFEQDLFLLSWMRKKFSADIKIRVDANGCFHPTEIFQVLGRLQKYHLEYIEQPIAPKQIFDIQNICKNSPVPIALDEELIGQSLSKKELLSTISPSFLILKPSLLGGFSHTLDWLHLAKEFGIQCRVTSALEANLGLSAIAQFTAEYASLQDHHGLGTGALYTNNTPSFLSLKGEDLYFLGSTVNIGVFFLFLVSHIFFI